MKVVHPRNESRCIWPACKMKFGSREDLQSHVVLVHQKRELSRQQRKRKLNSEEDEADEKVDCQVPGCGGSFDNFEVMLQHFKTTHQLKASRILKWRLKRTQVLELKRLKEAKLKRSEEEEKKIRQQLKSLTQRRKVKCGALGCKKKMGLMEAHMRLRHNKGWWRRCPASWCEASFKMPRDQLAHFEQYHMVEIHVSVRHTNAYP